MIYKTVLPHHKFVFDKDELLKYYMRLILKLQEVQGKKKSNFHWCLFSNHIIKERIVLLFLNYKLNLSILSKLNGLDFDMREELIMGAAVL